MGRTFDDFLVFIDERDLSAWVETDTVIGRVGGKTILTLFFTICNFGEVIPLIVTDNGGEFADVIAFENGLDGEKETSLFFCDPNRSYQKPHMEKNHTLLRDTVPKGTSFDDFTQDTVNLIFSHVNSVKRKVLGGKSPYELFCFLYGEKLANILGIEPVPEKDVIQSPKLLKTANNYITRIPHKR